MRWIVVGALGWLVCVGSDAHARVNVGDEHLSPLHMVCAAIQEEADLQEGLLVVSTTWGNALQAMLQLAALGTAWDAYCASSFGSMLRDAPSPGVPTANDLDGDFLFDEDELAFGLDLASADTDRDGLADDLDPSWLADLLGDVGQPRLAAVVGLAESEVRAGDRPAAVERLTEVQAALGCDPDPVGVSSDVCRGAALLTVHLGLR